MIDTVYIERDIYDDVVTQRILASVSRDRASKPNVVVIDRYSEVFNPRAQNFRLQKQKPALILARKNQQYVLPTPPAYHIGGQYNYYFSHMLNCIYDCRYCFLQGMYQSANYVVFTNYTDFFSEITSIAEQTQQDSWFFSGYDCDSLALEPVTEFMQDCLTHFELLASQKNSSAQLEIRTKSTQIRSLLSRQPLKNVVVAYSLSPHAIAKSLEHKTPSLKKRVKALASLQEAGWLIGLRFDPVIAAGNDVSLYREMFEYVFSHLNCNLIHSVSLGTFRLPKSFHKSIKQLYPEEPLFSVPLAHIKKSLDDGTSPMIGYPSHVENRLMDFCSQEILKHIDRQRLFVCNDDSLIPQPTDKESSRSTTLKLSTHAG